MQGLGRLSATGKNKFFQLKCFGSRSEIENNPRDCLIETALAEETRLEAKLLNDTEIELYKVNGPLKQNCLMQLETFFCSEKL